MMAHNEFRAPMALGGVSALYVYRDDLDWLRAKAEAESTEDVCYDPADILHSMIEALRQQGELRFRHRGWTGYGLRSRTPGRGRSRSR